MLLLSPDGNTLVEASRGLGDGYGDGFRAYNLATRAVLTMVPLGRGINSSLSSMAFSTAGDRLYVGTFTSRGSGDTTQGAIQEYDTHDYSLAYTYEAVCFWAGFGAGAMEVSVSPDGNTLFYADRAPMGPDGARVDDKFMALDRNTLVKT